MLVLGIVGVLVMVGMPSMANLLQSNRVSAELNTFVGDLQFARSEAIKQGVPVVLCASADSKSCSGKNTWQTGWIVYADKDGSGTQASDEPAIRARPAWTSADTFSASPSMSSLTFSRDGFATVPVGTGTAVTLALRTEPVNAKATRCVQLNRLGHQTALKNGAAGCE